MFLVVNLIQQSAVGSRHSAVSRGGSMSIFGFRNLSIGEAVLN